MGATRNPVFGRSPLPADVLPGRSPGPLGFNDAADPNALVCIASDTQGPNGSGGDAAEQILSNAPMSSEMDVPVMSVDLDKMRRIMFATAYAEEADRAATRGFASAEINLGEQRQIEAAARSRADGLMEEFQAAIEAGPEALQAFIDDQEAKKERARASLKKKMDDAQSAGKRWESVLGGTVKLLSVAKFGSTVTVKTVSIFTGIGGTAVDVIYSGIQAGVKQHIAPANEKTVKGVVVEETSKNVKQELLEEANELVAKGIMTRAEKNYLEGMLGNYRGNAEKIAEQIEKLEQKIQKAMKAEQGRKVANLSGQHLKKLAKLKELRGKTLRGLMGKGASGVAKKTLGKTLSLVFLKREIQEAWGEMANEWNQSN